MWRFDFRLKCRVKSTFQSVDAKYELCACELDQNVKMYCNCVWWGGGPSIHAVAITWVEKAAASIIKSYFLFPPLVLLASILWQAGVTASTSGTHSSSHRMTLTNLLPFLNRVSSTVSKQVEIVKYCGTQNMYFKRKNMYFGRNLDWLLAR